MTAALWNINFPWINPLVPPFIVRFQWDIRDVVAIYQIDLYGVKFDYRSDDLTSGVTLQPRYDIYGELVDPEEELREIHWVPPGEVLNLIEPCNQATYSLSLEFPTEKRPYLFGRLTVSSQGG